MRRKNTGFEPNDLGFKTLCCHLLALSLGQQPVAVPPKSVLSSEPSVFSGILRIKDDISQPALQPSMFMHSSCSQRKYKQKRRVQPSGNVFKLRGLALRQSFTSFVMAGASIAILDHAMTLGMEAGTWGKTEAAWIPTTVEHHIQQVQ